MFHSVEGSTSHMTFWLKGFSLLVVFEKGFVEDKKFGMQHVVALFDADFSRGGIWFVKFTGFDCLVLPLL